MTSQQLRGRGRVYQWRPSERLVLRLKNAGSSELTCGVRCEAAPPGPPRRCAGCPKLAREREAPWQR